MKKIITILFVLFLLPSLAACSKEEEKEIFIFDAQRELFRYEGTETAEQIAVDENGILYTTEFVYVDKQEGNWPEFYWNAEVYQESFKDEAKRYFPGYRKRSWGYRRRSEGRARGRII